MSFEWKKWILHARNQQKNQFSSFTTTCIYEHYQINKYFIRKKRNDANIPITHKTGEGLEILNLEFCGC